MDRAIINIFGIKFWAETKLIRLVMPHEVNFKGEKILNLFFFFSEKIIYLLRMSEYTGLVKILVASTIPY